MENGLLLYEINFPVRVSKLAWRQRGGVISVADSQSSNRNPGFEFRSDRYLDLFLGSPEFKSSGTLVNSQLVCLQPLGILKCYVQFDLFVPVVCSARLAFVLIKHCQLCTTTLFI